MSSNMDTDTLLEIFSRSLETVRKCRILSRELNRLTYGSMFNNLLSQRNNTISGYFVQTQVCNKFHTTFVSCGARYDTNTKISLKFLTGFKKILASTKQGLVLCEVENKYDHHTPEFVVCKPTTEQWCKIRNPRLQFFTLSTAMIVLSVDPLHYKIVRLSVYVEQPRNFYDSYYFALEVFDSNTGRWEQFDDVKLFSGEFFSNLPPISACGSLYWLTDCRRVLVFDGQNEPNPNIFLPEQFQNSKDDVKLTDYEGKLAVIKSSEDYMELWVFENYNKELWVLENWEMRFKVNLEAFRLTDAYLSPTGFSNADVGIVTGSLEMFFLKIANLKIDTVKLRNLVDNRGIFPFMSDFEKCEDLELKRETVSFIHSF